MLKIRTNACVTSPSHRNHPNNSEWLDKFSYRLLNWLRSDFFGLQSFADSQRFVAQPRPSHQELGQISVASHNQLPIDNIFAAAFEGLKRFLLPLSFPQVRRNCSSEKQIYPSRLDIYSLWRNHTAIMPAKVSSRINPYDLRQIYTTKGSNTSP